MMGHLTRELSAVVDRYIQQRPRSAEIYQRAVEDLPDGVTHDKRFMTPFPTYIQRAKGSRKWDVDGNEYVDYVMGHGALLLGHCHPEVTQAVVEQVQKFTHPGGSHELEVEWAELVKSLIPSAEKVRFTSSGTEATHMAIRLARAYTGRKKIVKLEGHFHGWHDGVAKAQTPPYDRKTPGIPDEISDLTLVSPAKLESIEKIFSSDRDIAAIIFEPSGASYGTVPLPEGFVQGLKDLCDRYGVLLIYDEVVTGFRWSPGGVQALAGIKPDLTTLAKILAGGFPGGAVAGRADILDLISHASDPAKRIVHQGTFNANPVSAAAGVECLKIVGSSDVCQQAASKAAVLRSRLNEKFEDLQIPGCAYGESSICHIIIGEEVPNRVRGDLQRPDLPEDVLRTKGTNQQLMWLFDLAMMNEGVDLFSGSAFVSSYHTDEDIDLTIDAFVKVVSELKNEGYL